MAATATAVVDTTAKAGFWIRTVAYIVDAIILGVIQYILGLVITDPGTNSGINFIIGLAYFVVLWSSTGGGQTVGMRIFNLKVIRTDGSALTYVQAFIRWLGLLLSFIVIFIGVIWVAFDANKQGWHDKIAGTYVVKTK